MATYDDVTPELDTPEPSPIHEKTPLIVQGQDADDETEKIFFKSKAARFRVIFCILVIELCERLTYYSISANLVLFCTSELNLTSAQAVTVSLVFTGTSYLFPIFGGFVADSISGKFNAIYGSALAYFIGAALLPVVAIDFMNLTDSAYELTVVQKRFFYFIALLLVSIGTGGIKSNVGPFGAQQAEDLGRDAVQTFFNWFYWFINIGSAVSFSVVAYVQQEISFVYGYLIPTISILFAIILLLAGRNSYINRPPQGSAYSRVFKIVGQSTKGITAKSETCDVVNSCLDRAKTSHGGSYTDAHVEEVKLLGRIIPIFLTIIPYWTIYFQMQSTYFLQGEVLRLNVEDFVIPISALNLFNIVIILVLIPVMDRCVYPLIKKCGVNFTPLRRIGFGMILATISITIAGITEIYRKNVMQGGGYFQQEINDVSYNSSNLTIFVQIPQFALVGASEVFTSITGLEFAFSQSPASMQGVVMGMFLLTSGLGSYLGSLLVAIVNSASEDNPWIPDDVNCGYLERFFFLLAAILSVDFMIFVILAVKYKYVDPEEQIKFTEISEDCQPKQGVAAKTIESTAPPVREPGFTTVTDMKSEDTSV
ncbi:solute carrier family 15 member 4-like [Saccoglossus kowalevskii]|uniref:Solute carrier family 15 member 4-like n=1 Tax=Saccoglossus kowalevskii TaxID=10224 RepID=A0ABM0GXD7_SACKO|nr:PREDICTED: solute carrier family 15 member 4-like [Saccoglossus kowalevskii]